ncbi:MAG TPA: hypothetical protein VKB50_05580 [Vicinamibacterales bacterium]|nr:hypothetical protein [Vicinamibacterales bacterium]
MAGVWISRIARRLTQPDTFDRLVSPAIADLQLESQRTTVGRWRHYPALAAVLLWALLRDVRRELAHVFDADAWRSVWTRAAAWALIAAATNWVILYRLIANVLNQWHTSDTARQTILNGVAFRSVGPALTVAMIVAAYSFKRRDAARTVRVVAATIVLAVTTVGATYLSTILQEPSRHALDEAARAFYGSAVEARRAPLPWQLLLNATSMIPFAWLGVVLARRRGWPLALIATGILGTYVWLNTTALTLHLYGWLASSIPGVEALLFGTYGVPPNLVTLVGLIAAWRAIERVFDRSDPALVR